MPNSYTPYTNAIKDIATEAGALIMEYYQGKIAVEIKDDSSPVTIADKTANNFIVEKLKTLTPQIPIISEENPEAENIKASKSTLFWLVDPLDGTKSYIKKTGDFTVNIALIENGSPVGGVVYVPAKNICYFTDEHGYAQKQENGGTSQRIVVRLVPAEGATIVASLSHRTEETDAYINSLPKVASLVSAASSIKFCLVAEGMADIYPRFGRTMEWDTAAGHAVLNAAGGMVTNIDGSAFLYGKDGLDNPYFIAKAATR